MDSSISDLTSLSITSRPNNSTTLLPATTPLQSQPQPQPPPPATPSQSLPQSHSTTTLTPAPPTSSSTTTATTTTIPTSTSTIDSQIHERLLRDYKRLKSRLDVLEKENSNLKTSLWELSWKFGAKKKSLSPLPPPNTNMTLLNIGTTTTATATAIGAGEGTTTTTKEKEEESTTMTTTNTIPTSGEFMKLNEPPISVPSSTEPHSTATTLGSTSTSVLTPLDPSMAHQRDHLLLDSSAAASNTNTSMNDTRTDPLTTTKTTSSSTKWKWTRAYDLKAHRGAVYSLKFSRSEFNTRSKRGGHLLGSAGFDGVRIWGPKLSIPSESANEEGREGDEFEEEDEFAWDDGEIEQMCHLTSHTGPVSDLAWSPSMNHLLSGGYDSQLYVHSLPSSSQSETIPIWSLATEGLVQSVDWLHPHSDTGSENGKIFAWGTSARILGLGDLRMDKPAMIIQCDGMINSVQSFKHTPTLLIGDSLGSIRHFSIRGSAFLPFPEGSATTSIAPSLRSTSSTGSKKGLAPISCLAVNPDWNGKQREPRWMASVGFDNFIRIFDRSPHDALKQTITPPKLIQTLKGKNRNWPIKTSFYQGRNYVDHIPLTKSKRIRSGGQRSRSTSFSSSNNNKKAEQPHDDEEEEDEQHSNSKNDNNGSGGGGGGGGGGTGSNSSNEQDGQEPRNRPLNESLLLAVGSSDPVVLIYDLTGPAPSTSSSSSTDASSTTSGAATSTTGASGSPESGRLIARLEGHKESVYAVDWLQPGFGAQLEDAAAPRYQGHGMLASAGGDWVIKLWKPVFKEEDE